MYDEDLKYRYKWQGNEVKEITKNARVKTSFSKNRELDKLRNDLSKQLFSKTYDDLKTEWDRESAVINNG